MGCRACTPRPLAIAQRFGSSLNELEIFKEDEQTLALIPGQRARPEHQGVQRGSPIVSKLVEDVIPFGGTGEERVELPQHAGTQPQNARFTPVRQDMGQHGKNREGDAGGSKNDDDNHGDVENVHAPDYVIVEMTSTCLRTRRVHNGDTRTIGERSWATLEVRRRSSRRNEGRLAIRRTKTDTITEHARRVWLSVGLSVQ